MILDLFEEVCGARLTYSYLTIGGAHDDLPEGWVRRCQEFLDYLKPRIEEYHTLLTRNHIFVKRTGEWQQGKGFMGGSARPVPDEGFEKVLRAVNIQTGEITWELPQVSGRATASAGVLSTASGVVFFGENSGSFMAADAGGSSASGWPGN